ncbi:MAG TPA: tripartite tricarboxylate transporter substrate-binding protein [Chloroflexota bacterium]|nr:tripartite tricarboxylate transporter substrate-binding protein [Chloroflexota bacterium]
MVASSLMRLEIPLVCLLMVTACAPASPAAAPTAASQQSAPPAAAPTNAPPATQPSAPEVVQPTVAASEDPALVSLWRGKTITMIVGDAAGGGTDTTGRIVARHLSRFLPGQPTIIVQNMPGAGHRVATNFVYQAKSDGLTIGLVDRGVPSYQLRGEGAEQGVRYDSKAITWLGSPTVVTQALMLHQRAGITAKNLKPLEEKTVTIGQTDVGGASHAPQLVLNAVLGWKTKAIFGYEGSTGRLLGIDRGEVDGILTVWDSLRRQKGEDIRAGVLLPIVHIGQKVPDPLLAGVPTADELLADKGAADKQLLALTQRPFDWGRPVIAPPGLPPNITAGLRQGMVAMMADQQFLAEAKQIDLDVIPVPGERVQALIEEYMSTPRSVIERLDELIQADTPA